MEYPENLKYTSEHEWVRVEENDTATIGITDFAQSELGDIVFVELEGEGYEMEQEEVFGTVEAVKTVSDLFAPVDGTIISINESLEDQPEQVNDDPYGDGWMIKIEMSDPSQLDNLMDSGEYQEIIA